MKRDPGALFFRPISDHFLYADWIEDGIWGIPSFRITTGKFGTTPIWPPEVGDSFFKKCVFKHFSSVFRISKIHLPAKVLHACACVFFRCAAASPETAVPVYGEFMYIYILFLKSRNICYIKKVII